LPVKVGEEPRVTKTPEERKKKASRKKRKKEEEECESKNNQGERTKQSRNETKPE
jgi:hypothetical protein